MPETKQVEIGKAISYGWESVKKDFWYLIGVTFIYVIFNGIASGKDNNSGLWSVVGLVITSWIMSGLYKVTLSYYDGNKLPLTVMFTQFKYFWRVLCASLLLAVIVIAGFLLFIIPGIYLALRYQFVFASIIDKDLTISEAMAESSKITKGNIWKLLGFGFVELGVIILGMLALGIGVFVAIPVVWLANIYIYKKLQ